MVQVMSRLPIVEDFVAILYWRICCGENIDEEEDVERNYWREKRA